MIKVKTEEELGKALEDDSVEIVIENPVLGKIVIKIKKAGNVKWVIAAGAIAVAVIAIVLMVPTLASGPAAPPAEGVLALVATTTASSAVAILGAAATIAAIKICLRSKSTKVLSKLRDQYDITENRNGIVVLKRKKI